MKPACGIPMNMNRFVCEREKNGAKMHRAPVGLEDVKRHVERNVRTCSRLSYHISQALVAQAAPHPHFLGV